MASSDSPSVRLLCLSSLRHVRNGEVPLGPPAALLSVAGPVPASTGEVLASPAAVMTLSARTRARACSSSPPSSSALRSRASSRSRCLVSLLLRRLWNRRTRLASEPEGIPTPRPSLVYQRATPTSAAGAIESGEWAAAHCRWRSRWRCAVLPMDAYGAANSTSGSSDEPLSEDALPEPLDAGVSSKSGCARERVGRMRAVAVRVGVAGGRPSVRSRRRWRTTRHTFPIAPA